MDAETGEDGTRNGLDVGAMSWVGCFFGSVIIIGLLELNLNRPGIHQRSMWAASIIFKYSRCANAIL